MCNKVELLSNIVLLILINNNIVAFGSDEHMEIIKIIEKVNSVEELKNYDNKYIQKALREIKQYEKFCASLKETGINIDTE